MNAPEALEAALDGLARGWSVVPIRPGGKHPLLRWEVFQARLPTEAEVREWYGRWPEAGVGVVTGRVSGLVVVDVDSAHGGEASLAGLLARYGPLPETAEAATGGGGRHLYFRHPGNELRSRIGMRPGLDLRGDGGLVVAPPSRHPSGRRYAWRAGRAPDDVAMAELPSWLHDLARGRTPRGGHPLSYWRGIVRDGVGEGERNNAVASLTGHLLWHGVDPDVITELLLCWNAVRCRPPLGEEEVVSTVDSIRRTHERHREED